MRKKNLLNICFFTHQKVWINGNNVGGHSGGHLPFEMEISQYVEFSRENNIVVAVNNTLTP